jgi:GT2 family glycosyltransferase
MELSVVIVSFNVSALLRQALHSLREAARGISHEIIVIDNDSSDGSAGMVEREFPDVRLIISGINEGYSAGCNRGIIASSGDFILVLNPDTVVSPDALVRALSFMHTNPDAGAAGAHMTDGNGKFLPESKRGFPSPLTSLFRFTGLGKLFPRSAVFNAYYVGDKPENETCRADILTGAFMLIRREALNKAGLFDTAFFMYGEDIDLSWRIRKAGYRNYYLHDVLITHFKGKSASQEMEESLGHFYNAMHIFAGKHLGKGWHMPVKTIVTLLRTVAVVRLRFRRMAKK